MPKKKEIVLQPSHIQVFDYIRDFIRSHIYAPMLSEVAEGTGIVERHVYRIIEDLIQLNYLSKAPHKQRGLRVLKREITQHK